MKTKILIATLSTAMLAAAPSLALADETREMARAVAAVDAVGNASASPGRACAHIAAETGADVKAVEQGKTTSGMGYGEVFAAMEIAKSSNRSFDDVVAAHKAGKDWCQIAHDAHVKVNAVVKASAHIEAAAAKEGEELKAKEQREFAKASAALNAADKKADRIVCAQIAKETGLAAETVAKAKSETASANADLMVAAQVSKGSADAFVKAVAEIKAGKTSAELAAQANTTLASVCKTMNRIDAAVEKEQRETEKRVAREKHSLEKKIAALNAAGKADAESVYVRISDQTGVAVQTLKDEKASSGLGFGELLVATEIANASGKSFTEVAAEFKNGNGFGEIAESSNVQLGKIISDANQVSLAVSHDQNGRIMAQANGTGSLNGRVGSAGASGNLGATGNLPQAPPVVVPHR